MSHHILLVEDDISIQEMVEKYLIKESFQVTIASDGEEGVQAFFKSSFDLVILDIMMPKLDGIATVKQLKADTALPFTPVILVTARADAKDVIAGLEAGGDDYLTKPVDQAALMARVRAMLRIKGLHDTVQDQARRLEDQAGELALWNTELEARVQGQLGQIERMGALKRFLAPQLAELIIARGEDAVLQSHRRDIVVVFGDLRGYTAFAETAEPEELLDLLNAYHAAVGPIVTRSEGTLDHFSGDGIMVFFNDPLPCPDAAERAVRMAIEMREALLQLQTDWKKRGRQIGFGLGIAQGYATLGQIGFAERIGYTAIGTVCNLAARLCAEAKDGQILISQRIAAAAESIAPLEEIGDLALKGLSQAVAVYNIAGD